MLLEAVGRPIRYHLADGRKVRLVPGQPVDLPDLQAGNLLVKAQGKVRLAAPPSPCRLCGADSWWRSGQAEGWQCRRCHPPASLPVYEVLSPCGKLDDGVKAQPRADGADWLAEWHRLARITHGITADDPRFQPVMAALDQCDVAFLANDWLAFQQAVARVWLAVQTEHER